MSTLPDRDRGTHTDKQLEPFDSKYHSIDRVCKKHTKINQGTVCEPSDMKTNLGRLNL